MDRMQAPRLQYSVNGEMRELSASRKADVLKAMALCRTFYKNDDSGAAERWTFWIDKALRWRKYDR